LAGFYGFRFVFRYYERYKEEDIFNYTANRHNYFKSMRKSRVPRIVLSVNEKEESPREEKNNRNRDPEVGSCIQEECVG
jgi:hypothetical protein